MQRQIKFQCAGVWVPAGNSCVYTYVLTCIANSDLRKIRLASKFPESPESNYHVFGEGSLIVCSNKNFVNLVSLHIPYEPSVQILCL